MVGQRGAYGESVDRVGQDASGQDKQVVEAELPLPSPVFGGLDRTAAYDLDEPVDDLVGEPLHLRSYAVVDGPEPVAHLVDGDAAGPVLLGASLGAVADVLAVGEDPNDG